MRRMNGLSIFDAEVRDPLNSLSRYCKQHRFSNPGACEFWSHSRAVQGGTGRRGMMIQSEKYKQPILSVA